MKESIIAGRWDDIAWKPSKTTKLKARSSTY